MCTNILIMFTSYYTNYIKLERFMNSGKIIGISTNKMHNVESAFVSSSIGYRAKNDPGDWHPLLQRLYYGYMTFIWYPLSPGWFH